MKSKKILAWPKTNGHNKYLDILYNHLEKYGYKVLSHKEYRWKFILKKIDYFHFHWIDSFVGFNLIKSLIATLLFVFYIRILKLKKVKIIWTMHNSNPFTHNNRNPQLEKFLVNFLFKNVDRIIIHSEYQKNHIPEQFHNKVFYIPHHNYTSLFKLHNLKEKDYYLFFGSIAKYKGIEDLIKVFNELSELKLIIVGSSIDKEYIKYLKSLIKSSNITLIDKYLNDLELEKFVKESKCVILPFRKITNSGSLIYAISCEKPVFIRESKIAKELKEIFHLKDIIYEFNNNECLLKNILKFSKEKEKKYFNVFLKNTDIENLIKKFYLKEIFC